MFKRDNNTLRGAATWLALLMPFAAVAGLSTAPSVDGPSQRASSERESKVAPGAYQIRCWQFGKLLFEENRVTFPADGSQYGVKLGGTDRNSRPVYVAETKNATCLIRGAVEERTAWPR